MMRGVRKFFVGSLVLLALAGCGRSILQYAQREPWRREAEASCLKSGLVREKPGLVRIEPIEGPGICGAEYPLKVASLGDVSHALGFAGDVIRPPGAIPQGSRQGSGILPQPRWPIAARPPAAPAPAVQQQHLPPPAPMQPHGGPLSLSPPGGEPSYAAAPPAPAPQVAPPAASGTGYRVVPTRPTTAALDNNFEPAPRRALAAPRTIPASEPPLPALGPAPAPRATGSVAPIEVKPNATLACPIVSALDRWIAQAVQPAAHKWFGQPVTEIRQISAYSCRGMNGQPGARISEHAFGNALDIAAFVLADGRRITIKNGWRGAPEEQGFLRDVQAAACDTFTTVLAPGSNRFHYDHFHVDLMRRASGRRICNPRAEDGELVASRVRGGAAAVAAARQRDPGLTASIRPRPQPQAKPSAGDDDDWIEDEGPRPAIDWGGDRHRVN